MAAIHLHRSIIHWHIYDSWSQSHSAGTPRLASVHTGPPYEPLLPLDNGSRPDCSPWTLMSDFQAAPGSRKTASSSAVIPPRQRAAGRQAGGGALSSLILLLSVMREEGAGSVCWVPPIHDQCSIDSGLRGLYHPAVLPAHHCPQATPYDAADSSPRAGSGVCIVSCPPSAGTIMLALFNKLLDWFKALFWKEEMELTLVGLQYSGKTTFVNVIAVRDGHSEA